MSHQWNASIAFSSSSAASLIESQFGLNIIDISLLGEGFDNAAYLINKTYVFRFPRREIGVKLMLHELSILPYLAKHLSFPFTHPTFFGQPTAEYPYAFAGYPLIQGRAVSEFQPNEVDLRTAAHTLGLWLRELHQIDPLESHRLELGDGQLWRVNLENRRERCTAMLKQYANYFRTSGFKIDELMAILDRFPDIKLNLNRRAYLHGDLYCKHVLLTDDFNLAGLIDWGDMHVGHPGIDVSVIFMLFDAKAQNLFLNSYGLADESTIKIASLRAFCHPFMLLPYAYEHRDEKLIAWAEQALGRGMTCFY